MVILTVMVDVIFSEGRVLCSFPYLHIMVLFHVILMAHCFCVLYLAEERNEFFLSPPPQQEPVSFHILTYAGWLFIS
jgi:hypothetical protein